MYLYNMFIDGDNFLWMSSNQGILKCDPKTLNSNNIPLSMEPRL